MKVKGHQLGGWEISNCCDFEDRSLLNVKKSLQDFNILKSERSPILQINNWFEEFGDQNEFMKNFRLNKEIPLGQPYANYRMDAVKDSYESSCGNDHRLYFQKCLDNRQAIGTNLLKFEIGANSFESDKNKLSLSFLLCTSKNFKREYSLDNSVATFEEYEIALRFAYRNFVHSRILLLEMVL